MKKTILQYFPERTQIIFFDLEFYVPECDRDDGRIGLKANPYRDNHFLIGGTFHRYFPLLENENRNVRRQYWIWKYNNSEEKMLRDILKFIEESWNIIKKKNNQAELFFSGIGISRADIQYLFARSLKLKLRTAEELYNIFYKARFLDFETIVIPYFNNKDNMLRTKSTNEIIAKFKIERDRGAAADIWPQFDNKEYKAIQERNVNEVSDLLIIYKTVIARIHMSSIIKKYKVETFERKCNVLIDIEEYEFFKKCYYRFDDEWYYLNEELNSDDLNKLYSLQERIRKD